MKRMIRKDGLMKKLASVVLALVMVLGAAAACADGWAVPGNGRGVSSIRSGISARLIEDLATRSGPSTGYTGCGSYRMKGQTVTALAKHYDNGGVLWVLIEFSYGGGYRRAWTGAKRLNLGASQLASLPEDSAVLLGYGTITGRVSPRFGPGDIYAPYSDRDLYAGDQVAVVTAADGWLMVECYHTDGNILRSWVPQWAVDF